MVLGLEREQRCDKALDLRRVVEIKLGKTRTRHILLLRGELVVE